MNLDIASKIIDKGRQLGADFVEIFEEESRSSTLLLKIVKLKTLPQILNMALAFV